MVLAVLVLGVAAVVANGALGGMDPEAARDEHPLTLPSRELTTGDVRELRFDVGPVGYDMAQVDRVLNRLADQLPTEPVGSVPARDEDWAPARAWAPDAEPGHPDEADAAARPARAAAADGGVIAAPASGAGRPGPRRSASPYAPAESPGSSDPAPNTSFDAE